MTVGLPDYYKYNLWANLRIVDACAKLSDAQLDAKMTGTFGSVRETLMHMLGSEEGYAGHLIGKYPDSQLKHIQHFPGFDDLRQRAKASGETLIRIAEQGGLERILHLDGGTYDAAAVIVLMQALQHSIDHRSQIATLMSEQGIEPPDCDVWTYNDEMH